MFQAAVPETAVHKKCEPRMPKNKIGLAEDPLIPAPAYDAMLSEQFCQHLFRILISARADARHNLRTSPF